MRPERRLDTHGAPLLDEDPPHLAALDQVDPERVSRPRESPRHVLVPGDAAARLVGRTEHRVAHVRRDVHHRTDLGHLRRLEPLGVDPVQHVRLDAADTVPHVLQRVRQVDDASLAEQQVVIELRLEPLPELERVLVDRGALVPEIVRADDRRVARDVPAGEPAALDHRHVGETVLLRQVVRGGEPVPAAAHDHDLVRPLRLGRPPEEVRVLAAQRVPRCAARRCPRSRPRPGRRPSW